MLEDEGADPDAYLLGGGTIVAARLGHRRSTDVDLLITGSAALDRWNQNDRETAEMHAITGRETAEWRFRKAMNERNGRTRVDTRAGLATVAFDYGGKLEMFVSAPMIPTGDNEAEIDGRRERVLSNAQILAGKLERAERMPCRDAFDLIVLGRTDPEAVEAAVNDHGPEWMTLWATEWRRADVRLADEVTTARGVNGHERTVRASV